MNRERVRQFVAALESGRYRQGIRYLRRGDELCALGVACDVSGLGRWRWSNKQNLYCYRLGDGDTTGLAPDGVRSDDDGTNCYPPTAVANWYGFPNSYRMDRELGDVNCSLMELNDDGESFQTLAEIMRIWAEI